MKNFVYIEVLYISKFISLHKRTQQTYQFKRSIRDERFNSTQSWYFLFLIQDDNKIDDLGPLSGLTNLKRLMANENKITSLEPLRNLTLLKTLEFCKFCLI